MSKRYCLALDLKDDPNLITAYKRYHEDVWPEVKQSLRDAGIDEMEIYLCGNRLMMIIETNERFSFEAKERADLANPKVQEWETLMWKFQQPLPKAKPGQKWVLAEKVFTLD
jgi:L-rhamnose mutarotase